jgi:hypothetical protein
MSALPAAVAAAEDAPAPLPLSPGRDALRVALAAVRVAQGHFDEVDRPVQALNKIIAAAGAAERELAEHQAERQQRLGAWLVDGGGERPGVSHTEVRAEREAKTARTDAAAAEKALPPLLAPRMAALAALNMASAQRDAALCSAAVDAAGEVVEAELKPAIEAVLRVEVRIQALRHALWMAGNRASGSIPVAPGAAGRIVEMIVAAKREVGVERDNAAGEEFLNRLCADPTAKL